MSARCGIYQGCGRPSKPDARLVFANVLVLLCTFYPTTPNPTTHTHSWKRMEGRQLQYNNQEEMAGGQIRLERNQKGVKCNLPKPRHHAAEEKHAVSLDKRGEEGKEAVDRHGNQQALPTAQLVRKATPKKGSKHHSQVDNAA